MSNEVLVLRGTLEGHNGWVTALATSSSNPDILLSASRDHSVIIWNLTRDEQNYGVPKRSLRGHSHIVEDVAISQDGAFAISASWDKTLRLWDLNEGTTLQRFVGHTNDVLSVAFSPDNRQIVSSGRDKTIKVWNTIGECKYSYEHGKNHNDWISTVRFSPASSNSNTIISAGWDKLVKVSWNLFLIWGLYMMFVLYLLLQTTRQSNETSLYTIYIWFWENLPLLRNGLTNISVIYRFGTFKTHNWRLTWLATLVTFPQSPSLQMDLCVLLVAKTVQSSCGTWTHLLTCTHCHLVMKSTPWPSLQTDTGCVLPPQHLLRFTTWKNVTWLMNWNQKLPLLVVSNHKLCPWLGLPMVKTCLLVILTTWSESGKLCNPVKFLMKFL